jgi:hypothetical protein
MKYSLKVLGVFLTVTSV